MPDSRAFAGLAYRISGRRDSFESVYLRHLNGTKTNPLTPRDPRATQYFAHPDWPFDRLREAYPDGRCEAGLAIGPEEWITLELTLTADSDSHRERRPRPHHRSTQSPATHRHHRPVRRHRHGSLLLQPHHRHEYVSRPSADIRLTSRSSPAAADKLTPRSTRSRESLQRGVVAKTPGRSWSVVPVRALQQWTLALPAARRQTVPQASGIFAIPGLVMIVRIGTRQVRISPDWDYLSEKAGAPLAPSVTHR